MQADGGELIRIGVGKRSVARVGYDEWRPVGSEQSEELQPRLDRRRLRKKPRHIFGADFAQVGKRTTAKMGELLLAEGRGSQSFVFCQHGLYSFPRSNNGPA